MPAQRMQLIDTAASPPSAPVLRIAVATSDLRTLDAHFGSARRFAVIEVTPESSRLVEAIDFDAVSDETGSHRLDGDDRVGPKIAALAGCHLLFVLAIGGPAAARVVGAHVHPIKVAVPEPIAEVVARVQKMMTGNPPPWLRKAMSVPAGDRSMAFLDEEA